MTLSEIAPPNVAGEDLQDLRSLEDADFPGGCSSDSPDLVAARSLFYGRLSLAGVRSGRPGEGAATVVFDFPGSDSRDHNFDDC